MIRHSSGRIAYKNLLKRHRGWAFLALLSSRFYMLLRASQYWTMRLLSLISLHHSVSWRYVADLHSALRDRPKTHDVACSIQDT